MARNKVQFQKGMSEAQFDALYGTEALCHEALAGWRWPDGFECPDCGGRAHCLVKRGARDLYQCNACRKQTSVKAGTIFAASKLPLRLWFKAMYLMTQSKKGISSIELGRRLGVTQTTAWALKQKLAQVMMERNASKRLKGDVQMDDAYLGGQRPGAYGREGKAPFLAAVSVTGDGKPDQIVLRRVGRFCNAAIVENPGAAFDPGRSRRVRWGSAALPPSQRQGAPILRSRPAADRKRPNTPVSNGSILSLATSKPRWWGPIGPYGTSMSRDTSPNSNTVSTAGTGSTTMIARLAYASLRTAPMPYRLLKLADVYA